MAQPLELPLPPCPTCHSNNFSFEIGNLQQVGVDGELYGFMCASCCSTWAVPKGGDDGIGHNVQFRLPDGPDDLVGFGFGGDSVPTVRTVRLASARTPVFELGTVVPLSEPDEV